MLRALDDDRYANVYIEKNNTTLLTTSSSVYFFDSSFHYKKVFTGIKNLQDLEKRKIEAYERLTSDRQGNLWGIKQGYVFLVDKKTMRTAKDIWTLSKVISKQSTRTRIFDFGYAPLAEA